MVQKYFARKGKKVNVSLQYRTKVLKSQYPILNIKDTAALCPYRKSIQSWCRKLRKKSVFDVGGNAVDGVCADPAIDATAIIADLKTWPIDSFNQVEINVSVNFHQNDVTDF